jgi:hypothetical protein
MREGKMTTKLLIGTLIIANGSPVNSRQLLRPRDQSSEGGIAAATSQQIKSGPE